MIIIKYNWLTKVLILILLTTFFACSTSKQEYKKRFYDLVLEDYKGGITLDTNYIKDLAVFSVIEGSRLQQTYRYAESILEFQEALKYDSSASIEYAMARSYSFLGKYETAIDILQSALKKEPDFIPAMELLVDIYAKMKLTNNAITILNHIINLEPKRSRKIFLGQLYESIDPNKAITTYEELLAEKTEPEILIRIATLYEKLDKKDKMIETYSKLLQYSQVQPIDYDRMINVFLENQDYQRVMIVLDSVKSKFLDDDINYFYNLVASSLIDDSTEASNEYSRKIINYIENHFYFDWRMNMIGGFLAEKLNDSLTTIKLFNRALKSDSIADIPLSISQYYQRKNDYKKAIEILDEYNQKFPTNISFPLYKSYIYQYIKQEEKALSEAQKALLINDKNTEVLSLIGLLYDHLGKYDSCEIAYRKVLLLEPDNALVNNNLAYSMAERGINLDTALLLSQKSLNLEPDNPSYLDTYGWIHYQLGNYELALDYIKKAISAGEENAEVLEHLGFIYLKLNQKNEAIDAWKKSLNFEKNEELESQLKILLDNK
jgi:tetratricopeptide (TPR) repeat protein